MWIWIIGAIVVCVVIAAFAQAQEDEEKKNVAAKLPDAFTRLFSEEFPNFSGNITFTKAEAAIKAWDTGFEDREYTKHKHWFREGYFKNEDAKLIAETYLVSKLAKEISHEFLAYVQENPVEGFNTVNRVIISSRTLS